MDDADRKAADVIDAYRRRRERTVPLLLGGLAIVLLVIGVFLVVMYITGGSEIAFLDFLASDTPTPTMTSTPLPPTETPTITPTATATQTPTQAGPLIYIVEPGDVLSAIAEQFEVDLLVLMALNKLTDANAIFVGQELLIPQAGDQLATPTALPLTLLPGQEIEYIVMPGDYLGLIASRFNSTVEAIIERNQLNAALPLYVGLRLFVPVGLVTPVPTSPSTATPTSTS